MSGDGDAGAVVDEPEALPEAGGVDGLEEDEEGEDDGELELMPFFEALSPQAARVNAATAAISRDLVIPVFLKGIGGRNSRVSRMKFHPRTPGPNASEAHRSAGDSRVRSRPDLVEARAHRQGLGLVP
jgi:hypothetical protein